MNFTIILALIIAGLIGGFFSGLFGIGGGIIYVVVLQEYFYYVTNLQNLPHAAVQLIIANSMFAVMWAGCIGTIKQWLMGTIYPRSVFIISSGGLISSFICNYLIAQMPTFNNKRFVIVFTILFIFLILQSFYNKKERGVSENENNLLLFLFGIIAGIVFAFTGLGGGIVIVPLLHQYMYMEYKKAISISLGFMAIVALINTINNILQPTNSYCIPPQYFIGYINFLLILPLVISIIVATPYGVILSKKIPGDRLKIYFLCFVFLMISYMIYKAFF